jgi:hypothetical protein
MLRPNDDDAQMNDAKKLAAQMLDDWDGGAAYDAEIAEAAGTSNSPNAKYCHRLDPAAEIIAKRSGVPISGDSLRKSDVPRIYVGRIALFAEDDLHRFADERLNRAVLHQGPRALRPRERRQADDEMASGSARVSAE